MPTKRDFTAKQGALPVTILAFGGVLTVSWNSFLGYLFVKLIMRFF